MDTKLIRPPASRLRRRHSVEFKAQIVEACLQPGISVAAVALANQLNANFVRGWVREYRRQNVGTPVEKDPAPVPEAASSARSPAPTLVPVTVESSDHAASSDIQIEVRRQQTVVKIAWPVAEAESCARLLRALLQ